MKKIVFTVSLIIFLIITNCKILTAKEGSDQTGLTLSICYDGSWLSYQEIYNASVLDKDTGWLNGMRFELRGDTAMLFTRFNFNYSQTNSAKYSSSLQDGTPISMTTPEEFYQTELNIGFKALNFSTATLSPYVAYGYRNWLRGQDSGSDYQENYSWQYIAVGLNLTYRYNKWLFSLDGAVESPINPKMTTNISGSVDNATFNIKSKPGYRIEVTISYNIYKDMDKNIFIFGTPYYQRWNIGESDIITLTQGGVPLPSPDTYALEPKSSTDIYGFRFGIGFNF